MGFWQNLFSSNTPPPAPVALTAAELVARIQAGGKVNLDAALHGLDDDEEEARLWAALPHTEGALRVEVIEWLADFELEPDRQKALVLAAVDRVPGAAWTVAVVATTCDLVALTEQAVAADDGAVLDAIALLITALCEAALGQGPASEYLDLDSCAETVEGWCFALAEAQGSPGDLVALALALQVCTDPTVVEAEGAEGWDSELADHLRERLAGLLARPPRGAASWSERILRGVHADQPDVAVQALAAAQVAQVPVRETILARVLATPEDEGAWALAGHLRLDAAALAVLAPLATATLVSRREREAELCSPASQAACKSCGPGADAAADDDLMVPRAVEALVQPLLSACAALPGQHPDLVRECLEAPSVALRSVAAAVLQAWPAEAIPDDVWSVVAALAEDSHPQVRTRVAAVLARGRKGEALVDGDDEDDDEDAA